METKTKKKTNKQLLQRIAELESQAELGGSRLLDARAERDEMIEEAAEYQRLHLEGLDRIRKLENHARGLRSYMTAAWRTCDLLRDLLVAAMPMPGGGLFRDRIRNEVIGMSLKIVPGEQETNLNEDGPGMPPASAERTRDQCR